jgi:hypothetical protein
MTHCLDPIALNQHRKCSQESSRSPCVVNYLLNLAGWRGFLLFSFQTCLNMCEPELMADG